MKPTVPDAKKVVELPEQTRFLENLAKYREFQAPESSDVAIEKLRGNTKLAQLKESRKNVANKTIASRRTRYGGKTMSKSGQRAVGAR